MTWTLAQARARIAETIANNMVPGKLVAVYVAPPPQIVAPCAVIAPRSPYITPSAYNIEEVQWAITVFVPHSNAPDALDKLEALTGEIALNIELGEGVLVPDNVPNRGYTIGWSSIDSIGTVSELGGITYLTATINITAHMGALQR